MYYEVNMVNLNFRRSLMEKVVKYVCIATKKSQQFYFLDTYNLIENLVFA